VHTELKKANIDIVVADEGHRLKTEKNKAAQAIRALNTPRRVILSGTPLQNDLHEFFIMVYEIFIPSSSDTLLTDRMLIVILSIRDCWKVIQHSRRSSRIPF
jgi:hypothetical protein